MYSKGDRKEAKSQKITIPAEANECINAVYSVLMPAALYMSHVHAA